jgi:cyclopropane fatty-acyl-phospholipid synthase-like methyltransferase
MSKIITYYEGKTRSILQRYGPGPRVHYHTGLLDEPPRSDASVQMLRQRLIDAQERTLRYAADAWRARSTLCGDILDVGCGLGGGAIFWAQEFGAKVTAVTIAPSHIELVAEFAAQAGVESRVRPLLSDALVVPGEGCYDAAVAIDSSSSFPRGPWFNRLATLLRPRGHVFIFDCFLEDPKYEEQFNRHWCAQIGTTYEYLAAAQEAHFKLESMEDVSLQSLNFWSTTLALMRAQGLNPTPSTLERAKLEESIGIHTLVRKGLCEGGLRHVLMSLVKQ